MRSLLNFEGRRRVSPVGTPLPHSVVKIHQRDNLVRDKGYAIAWIHMNVRDEPGIDTPIHVCGNS